MHVCVHLNSDVFVFQLTEQCSTVMKELQSVQAELLKAAELQRRAERERDDLIRESQRLGDTVCTLEREKEELAQVKEELRYNQTESVFVCLTQLVFLLCCSFQEAMFALRLINIFKLGLSNMTKLIIMIGKKNHIRGYR